VNAVNSIGLVISAALGLFLAWALLFPEKF
jgi:K+-transporting ATPase KdpF subunit